MTVPMEALPSPHAVIMESIQSMDGVSFTYEREDCQIPSHALPYGRTRLMPIALNVTHGVPRGSYG